MRKRGLLTKAAATPVPIFPDPEKEKDDRDVGVLFRLPRSRIDDLTAIAEHETSVWSKAGRPKRWTRTAIADQLLRWAIDQYWLEKGGRPPSKKR